MNASVRRMRVALAVTLVTFAAVAYASTFPYFSPATGILKGNASTYVTTAAASSDVIGLWTGTCNSSSALKGDGTCGTLPAGTVSSVGLTMPSGFSVANSPVTSTGTLAVTTTLNGVLKGNGSGFTTSTSADIIGLWTGTCNATSFLRGDGACATAGGGGTPGGNNTDIQYNNAGAFGAEDAFAYDASTNTLTAGDTTTGFTLKGAPNAGGNSRVLTIIGGQPGPTNIGAGVIIDGGPGGSSTGFPGSVTIRGGTPVDQNGSGVTIQGSAGVGTNRGGGGVTLVTGAPTGSGTGGSISMSTGGTGAASGGGFSLSTGGTNRLTIDGGGAWSVAGAVGAAGSVLSSNGAGTSPTWLASTGTGSNVLSAAPAFTGSPTVGGVAICLADGTNCPGGGVTTTSTTFTLGGCSAGTTGTITFFKVGKMVQVMWQNRTCTSTGGSQLLMAFTYPAGYEPSVNALQAAQIITNNNAEVVGKVIYSTSTCGGGVCFQTVPAVAFTGTVGNYGTGNGVFGTGSYNTN